MKKILSLALVLVMILSAVSVTVLSASAKETDNTTSGEVSESLTGYCSTNPNGQVGKYANINVTSSSTKQLADVSEWDSSMLIAQGVANDDPRVYRPSSMHENPVDTYALYAAWDDSNLYLMWELKNMQDIVAPNDNYPLSQGWLYENHDLPYFIAINTGKHTAGDGTFSNGDTIWSSGLTWEAPIDTLIANSMNFWNGPYVYTTNSNGKFEYNNTVHSEIIRNAGKGAGASTECWGINGAYGTSHNRVPGDITNDSAAWIDFYTTKHSKTLDYYYEVAIPFSTLGIDRDYLENTGISIMHVQTFGTSGMNSLPVDLSMSDNAAKAYSKESSSSKEKEDEDHITVPLAQIGKYTGTITPAEEYLYGDVDENGIISVTDATKMQMAAAMLDSYSERGEKAADVNNDGIVSVTDISNVQMYIAGIITEFPAGEKFTL